MRVTLCSSGPLADAVGGGRTSWEVAAGARVADLLEAASGASAEARRILAVGPNLFLDGAPVAPERELRDGDTIHAVLALPGG